MSGKVRKRARLRAEGLYEKLFAEVNRQLEGKGMMVKSGTLIDATIIEARAKPPGPKEGEVSAADPDAGFTKKRGRSHFGYKLHTGVDEGSGLIRSVETTSANVHDSLAFKALVMGDEGKVYAPSQRCFRIACRAMDKAYGSQAHRDFLKAHGIGDGLMYKAARNKPLKSWQKWFNIAVSSIRAEVERVYGTGKTGYGLGKTRYFGEARVAADHLAFATAYNMRRALSLTG